MTNHHVINGVEKVKVILSDQTVVDAQIKGSEAYSDIAVLSIKSDKVKSVAVLGDTSKLNVGDTLFTVGSPEGADYAGSVTKGILSGKDRLVAVALTNNYATIGTMTYISKDNSYAAVAHDLGTDGLRSGNIYIVPVHSVIKSTKEKSDACKNENSMCNERSKNY